MLTRLLFWLIILANLGGAAFGFLVYYGRQLSLTSPLLWIFVPDCPLYALLFAAAFLFRAEPRPALLRAWLPGLPDLSCLWFIIFAGALKYGFWTVFVLTAYSSFYFTPQAWLMYAMLYAAHLFLMFETALLAGRIRIRKSYLLVGLAWLLANDLSDYLLGTHPPLPEAATAFMFPATAAMSMAFTLLAYFVLGRYSQGKKPGNVP
jgi:uncharacterized membrane protein YpjA